MKRFSMEKRVFFLLTCCTLMATLSLSPLSGAPPEDAASQKDGESQEGANQTESVEPAAEPSSPRAALRWKAAQEENTYGYLVYRSDKRQGPFLRLGRKIVRAKGGDAVNSYEFIDRDVVPGQTYYYYLDQINKTGKKVRFSGVLSKTIEVGEEEP